MEKEKIEFGIIICESCKEIVGDDGSLKSFPNNPSVTLICRYCNHKTYIRNPYCIINKDLEVRNGKNKN